MVLDNKIILVTGGTGSFGRKFIETCLNEHNPKSIRIFSRGEVKQLDMSVSFKDHEKLRFFIGDVRDSNRLHRAMDGVDIVVHTAALKQVPTCEYNPIEAVRTNIDGAVNVIDAAIDKNVEKVIALSTDKAVYPVNMYGATKLVSEKLFVQGNSYTGTHKTKFSCVRYGNVIGSRGSVIPVFLSQKEKGILTITDDRMTRFWITLEQGVDFVINCIDRMKGGEIFVPKIPSMRLMDLADTIAPEAEKRIVGLRPGEKIDEFLLTEEEAAHTREFDDYFVIKPEYPFWSRDNFIDGKPIPDGFRYSSDNNNRWISKDELREIIEKLECK